MKGAGWLDKRDQERNQVEYQCRLEEHRARQTVTSMGLFRIGNIGAQSALI